MTKKHVSLQVTEVTIIKTKQLAEMWDLPPHRFRSAVHERAIAIAYAIVFGKDQSDARKASE